MLGDLRSSCRSIYPKFYSVIKGIGPAVLHLPMVLTVALVFVATFLPVFYTEVFLPCYECEDFQATMAHEIGHLLGFDHPDVVPHRNLNVSIHTIQRLEQSGCQAR